MYQSETGAASPEVQRPIVPYYEVDGEAHMASSDIEAFLDCARYNEEGNAELLKMYLDAHPEYINLTDSQGRTAIHMAAANNHVKLLEIMMMYHPQPNKVNQEGNTALHFAALNNSIDASKLLIRNNWSTSARNAFGKTPLQLIQGKDYHELETLFIEHDQSFDDDKLANAEVMQESACVNQAETEQEQCNGNVLSNVNMTANEEAAEEDSTQNDMCKTECNNNAVCFAGEKEKTFEANARDENEEEDHHLPSAFDPKALKALYFGSINMDDVEEHKRLLLYKDKLKKIL